MEVDLGVDIEGDPEGSWSLLSWLASCVMVFGGVVPYIPQYQEIQRTSNTEGFSTRVCLVLLVANILRVFFWIGKQFELTLLLQSLVMIGTMLAMLNLCCTVQTSNRVSTKQHHFTVTDVELDICFLTSSVFCRNQGSRVKNTDLLTADLDIRYFWSWSRFEDYLMFCFAFTVLCAFITFLLLDSALFVESLGLLSVLTEAMLGIPQLVQNFQNRSTRGMSVKMVLLWTVGDVFKTTYFVVNESPTQFWLCGATQICIDIAILLQVCYYGQEGRPKYG
ncbi:PQLC1 protein, partial [Amia calva]|nr:PQLC1 protein [Amia calva]